MLQRVMEALGVKKPPAKRCEEEPALARMCVERVCNFSSQYGGENSRGYTASNLSGEACKYPHYGDFSEAFVLVCLSSSYNYKMVLKQFSGQWQNCGSFYILRILLINSY